MSVVRPAEWLPLVHFRPQFDANVAALTARGVDTRPLVDAAATQDVSFRPAGNEVGFARRTGDKDDLEPIPCRVPPAEAHAVARRLFPSGAIGAACVLGGVDHGWLWSAVSALPLVHLNGHRPRVYLVEPSWQALAFALHLQDWRAFLADSRTVLCAGPDALDALERFLRERPIAPLPPIVFDHQSEREAELRRRLAAVAAARDDEKTSAFERLSRELDASAIAARFDGSAPLKVLGLATRYSTFARHSMLDWLRGFERLGHRTVMAIEASEHDALPDVALLCDEHRPDLVLLIDHYRAQMGKIPAAIPCVMWIQDRLPWIFSEAGAAAQGPRDYTFGFGGIGLTRQYGYPAERYLESEMLTNEERFAPRAATPAEIARFGCDVSYVSHASERAEVLFEARFARCTDDAVRPFVKATYEALVERYARADTEPYADAEIYAMLHGRVSDEAAAEWTHFLHHAVQNALFRHQAIRWCVEAGAKVHLYGRGWEKHPEFSKLARGVADNETELVAIYRATAVNLQATPHGSAHQRMIDGLAAGAFFLLRRCYADKLGLRIAEFARELRRLGIETDADFERLAPPELARARADLARVGVPLHALAELKWALKRSKAAGELWGDDYDLVAFGSRAEAAERLKRYLGDPAAREDVAQRMRRVVLDELTQVAKARELVAMIHRDATGAPTAQASGSTPR